MDTIHSKTQVLLKKDLPYTIITRLLRLPYLILKYNASMLYLRGR